MSTLGKSLKVVERERFFDDAFFREAWDDFDRAMQSVLDKFDNTGLKVDAGSRTKCQDVYSKIRSDKINEDLYASQAVQINEKEGKFQAVMDVKDFNPQELQVRAVDERIVVEGSYQKVSEDGSSSSCKSFYREFALPPAADIDQVATALSKDGILTIKAPKKEGYALGEGPRPSSSSSSNTSSNVQQSSSPSDNNSSFKSSSSRTVTQSSSSLENSAEGVDSLPREMREKLMFCDSGFGSMKTSTCSSPAPSEAGSESSRVSSTMEFDLAKKAPVRTEVAFNVSTPSQSLPSQPPTYQQPPSQQSKFQPPPPPQQPPPNFQQEAPQYSQFQQQPPQPQFYQQPQQQFQQQQPQQQYQAPPQPHFHQTPQSQFQSPPQSPPFQQPPQYQSPPPQPQFQSPPPQSQFQSPPPQSQFQSPPQSPFQKQPQGQFQQQPQPQFQPQPQSQFQQPLQPNFQPQPPFMSPQSPQDMFQQFSQFGGKTGPQPMMAPAAPQPMAPAAPQTPPQPVPSVAVGSGKQSNVNITEKNGRRVLTSQTSNVVQEKDGFMEHRETAAEITDKDSQAARREASSKMSRKEEDPKGKFKRAESADAAEVSESCVQHMPDGSVMSVKKSSTSSSSFKHSFSSGSEDPFFQPPQSFATGFEDLRNLMGRGHNLMSQMSTDSMGSTLSGRSGFSDMSNLSHFSDTSSQFSDRSNFSNMSSFPNMTQMPSNRAQQQPSQQQQQYATGPGNIGPQDLNNPGSKSFSNSFSSSSSINKSSFSSNFGDGNF